ncbi:MAG: TIGR03016 family PEP-CTERM system-associated outer membrane protein [Rhodocyclaceae bacterium]|nr:TIGR03016 family PEP-CTERM system-associated outer membrane protein [Rhodocyclaceae bacterium]
MKPSVRLLGSLFRATIFLGLNGIAFAQTPAVNSSFSSTSVGTGPTRAQAQASAGGRDWIIKPRITLTETLTDNVSINRANRDKQGDLITEVAPGLRIEARTARLKAYFDYALRGQMYARNSDYNQTQNSLNTFGTLEAVSQWLFVDFSGAIAQQAISAFGAQSPGNSTINNNNTETASYRVSPYIRGQLGGLVEYLLRYNLSTTRSDANIVSDTNIAEWVGQLRGSTPFQALKWSIDASQQNTDYSRGRDTDADRIRAMLTYTVLPQLRLSVSGGREANNYASLDQETNSTHGYGFDWSPTERTKVSAFKESRFFGDGHNFSFSHRMPRSSIRISDAKDVSVLPSQFTTGGLGTVYDLYYQIYSNVEPYASMDPAIKDAAVASVVNGALAQAGISPNSQVTSSFLSSRATLQRRQDLALALFGARNSVTLIINRTESQSVLAASASNDDFSQSTLVKQQGLSLNFSHRLSALTNLNALGSFQESKGNSTVGNGDLKTSTTTFQVNISSKLGAKTSGTLAARRTEFDSTTNPYTENALIGTLSFIY